MTDKEKAIVMAHTGICMLAADKFQIFHKYVEDIMNRPIMTHELGWLRDEIKEKSKADFMALCTNESSSENPNKWIPVSERLPENNGDYLVTIKSSDGTAIITFQMVDHFGPGWLHEEKTRKIIAWMPLPSSYERGEEV